MESQLDLGLKAVHALEQATQATAQIQKAAGPESIRAALNKAAGDLRSVLRVVESADRRPPAQALALYDEASRELENQLEKWNAARSKLPSASSQR